MKKNKPLPTAELFASQTSFKESESYDNNAPLAVRMRPQTLAEIIGQEHLTGPGKLLRRTIEADRFTSIILYGPPGTGKTTLARILASTTKAKYVPINAVDSSVGELRKVIEHAKKMRQFDGSRTMVFIDEIHRFNRSQQDVLMPDVEEGTLILVGATTQNPSYSINNPLLSRAIVFELRPHEEKDLKNIVLRAKDDQEKGFGKLKIELSGDALEHLVKSAVGDARRALNAFEVGVLTTPKNDDGVLIFDRKVAEESCQRKVVYHDRGGDYHYDIASAFIKSMRGSDPDASVYWLAKMLYGGEDPRFIIRRVLILASEDIGNADPQALILASSALQAIEFVGMPEARIILAHVVTYMACAPKSNAAYAAINQAMADVRDGKIEEVPDHLRDGSAKVSKELGHGVGYEYAHKHEDHYIDQLYFPKDVKYYEPTDQGDEKRIKERLEYLRNKPPKKP